MKNQAYKSMFLGAASGDYFIHLTTHEGVEEDRAISSAEFEALVQRAVTEGVAVEKSVEDLSTVVIFAKPIDVTGIGTELYSGPIDFAAISKEKMVHDLKDMDRTVELSKEDPLYQEIRARVKESVEKWTVEDIEGSSDPELNTGF